MAEKTRAALERIRLSKIEAVSSTKEESEVGNGAWPAQVPWTDRDKGGRHTHARARRNSRSKSASSSNRCDGPLSLERTCRVAERASTPACAEAAARQGVARARAERAGPRGPDHPAVAGAHGPAQSHCVALTPPWLAAQEQKLRDAQNVIVQRMYTEVTQSREHERSVEELVRKVRPGRPRTAEHC